MSAEAPAQGSKSDTVVRLLAVVGGLGILAALILLFTVIAISFWRPGPFRPAEVQAEKGEPPLTVYGIDDLEGTNLLELRIGRSDSHGGSYSYSERDTRNIILLDKTTGKSRRILPDNTQRIADAHYLRSDGGVAAAGELEAVAATASDDRSASKSAPVAYYLLELRRPDDRVDLVLGRIADGRQAKVMTGLDGLDSYWLKNGRLGLVVRENRRLFFRTVDIGTLRQTTSVPIETCL